MSIVQLSTSWLDYPSLEQCILIIMSGCNNNCLGCQNPNLKKEQPSIYSSKKNLIMSIKQYIKQQRTNKIVFTGGDPLYEHNIDITHTILQSLGKTIEACIYTGLEEEAFDIINNFSTYPLYVKTGSYIGNGISEKTDDYIKLASPNQKMFKYIRGLYICISCQGTIIFKRR
jgi:organic radical activating enzyme